MAILSFALFWRKTLRRSVCIRSFSGLYFPVFGPEKLRIRSFHAVKCFHILLAFYISNIVGNIFFKYKLVQNIVDKYTKLSNISIFIEHFTADFSQFCSTTVKIYLLEDRLNTCLLILNISGIFLSLSRLSTREATLTFTSWWK